MRPLALVTAALLWGVASATANAGCVTSDARTTCATIGSSAFAVQKFGTVTITKGHNPHTAGTWTHQRRSVGDITIDSFQTRGRSLTTIRRQPDSRIGSFSSAHSGFFTTNPMARLHRFHGPGFMSRQVVPFCNKTGCF